MLSGINNDFLKKTTQKAQERLKKKKKEEKRKEDKEIEKEAQEWADEIIKDLASNLQKAARNGEDCLRVMSMITTKVQMKAARMVATYSKEQGLSVVFREDKGINTEGIPPHHDLVVSWKN